jgi:Pheromone A receptor
MLPPWFFEHCLISGINAIVWTWNVNDSAPAWCKISEAFCDTFNHRALIQDIRSAVYLINGQVIAFPAATLCICKHLEYVSSGRTVFLDKRQWRKTCFELFMCVGLPCLWMLLCKSSGFTLCSNLANHSRSVYCFQPRRYFIEDFGCISSFWSSSASIIILFVPPLLLAVVTLAYGSK